MLFDAKLMSPDDDLLALVDVDAGRGGNVTAHIAARQVIVVPVKRAARPVGHGLVDAHVI